MDAGVVVKGGSDVGPFDPLLGLWTCVTRTNVAGEPMDPTEAITREEALRIYTINGAYGTFEEDIKGSIEPGKLADMLVLSDDLLTVPEDGIREIKVLSTYVGGREVYRA
jgi:predicted amidohydrolase YtcJ